MKETITPKKKGQHTITFNKGGLHRSLHVPSGKPIPEAKLHAAMMGEYGPKAKKQAMFRQNVLKGRG